MAETYVTRVDRRGVGVLGVVLFFGLAASILVAAYYALWRGSGRTLASLQERRLAINLARSALAESHYRLQKSLDEGRAEWVDCFLFATGHPPKSLEAVRSRAGARKMTVDPRALEFSVGPVRVKWVRPLDVFAGGLVSQGVVDLEVDVEVRRARPRHRATITMIERRGYWLTDDAGPLGYGGRRFELSPTPVVTWIDEGRRL